MPHSEEIVAVVYRRQMKKTLLDEDEDCEGCDTLWVHPSPEQQPAASSLPIHVAPPGKSRVLGAVVPGMSLLLGFHARWGGGGGRGLVHVFLLLTPV